MLTLKKQNHFKVSLLLNSAIYCDALLVSSHRKKNEKEGTSLFYKKRENCKCLFILRYSIESFHSLFLSTVIKSKICSTEFLPRVERGIC